MMQLRHTIFVDVNFYQIFVQNFSKTAIPMTSLMQGMKKKFIERGRRIKFPNSQKMQAEAPVLRFSPSSFDSIHKVHCGTSGLALGKALSKGHPMALQNEKSNEAKKKNCSYMLVFLFHLTCSPETFPFQKLLHSLYIYVKCWQGCSNESNVSFCFQLINRCD